MGAAVEIRDIKIINQCLEVQRGVVACFSLSVCLSLRLRLLLLLYFSLRLLVAHFVFCALSGGSIRSESRSQSSKSGFKCSHTQAWPTGTIPPSHLTLKVEDTLCICVWCICLHMSSRAVSRQLIAQLSCCNLLMDHHWGVICIMQKLGVLTPLKTDSFNPLYASPLLCISCLCVQQEEVERQNKAQIFEL